MGAQKKSARKQLAPGAFPNRLDQLIRHRGLQKASFAQALGISNTTLSYYVTGRRAVPHDLRAKCAELLQRPVDEIFPLTYEFIDNELRNGQQENEVSPWETSGLQPSLTEPAKYASTSSASAVHPFLETQIPETRQSFLELKDSLIETSPDMLEHFEEMTTLCRRLSEGSELKTAERTLWSYLPRVDAIAKLSFTHQQKAASVASQSYLLAASLAGHRNDLQARYQLSEQALLYGKLAHDFDLQIAALRQFAVTFDYLGYPEKVLQVYQLTLPHLHKASPLLRACIYADMSGSYTQLHQQQEAHTFLNMAYDHFPENTHNEPGYVSTICRYSTLILCEGLHHLAFEQARNAERSFEKIDGLHPKIPVPERIRIDVLNCQVEAFMASMNLEAACFYLESAVEASLSIGSERRFQEAYSVFQQMQATWGHERRVQSLTDLFRR
ncbi:helix-turn-helix transcriptional regulator [Ktedonospora formicarum]|uniref:HTH cro/C1-type domain-containing protein n=1 Tax=Ktedonospora formicarum TaxID=2778364 RepID=A0A8J3MUU3_9CHLR|nr:helix-turn-helix transcriptional regulator [Ktedonospora formicarum]GHO48580.1 hypothetical protein KSX_67430 [Ktedonospora formicarum]